MKITIESTTKLVTIVDDSGCHAVPARVWEGVTESGIQVQCLIVRIAAPVAGDLSQFEAELQEQRAPSAEVTAFPLRMIL